MGVSLSSLWGTASQTKNYTITMLGLDGAGKTTILHKLKRNEAPDTVPTIGFNVESISPNENVNMCIMDVGGQDRLRDLWQHYYEGAHAIIFVVDSNDAGRFEEAKKQLSLILQEEKLRDALLLVYANKQDMARAASVLSIADSLSLRSLAKDRKWFIQGRHLTSLIALLLISYVGSCATSGDGLWAGIYWLAEHLG